MQQQLSIRMNHSQDRYITKLSRWDTTHDYIVWNSQICQWRHKYTMQKHINTDTDIMVAGSQNHLYTGNIYDKLLNTKHTQRTYCVKCTNLSQQT